MKIADCGSAVRIHAGTPAEAPGSYAKLVSAAAKEGPRLAERNYF